MVLTALRVPEWRLRKAKNRLKTVNSTTDHSTSPYENIISDTKKHVYDSISRKA
jgi:hypothetical protein